MPSTNFGVGFLTLVPNAGTYPAPVQVGVLQNVSIDISAEEILLYGANSFAVDVAHGKKTIKGKAQSAVIGSGTIAAVLGTTLADGATSSITGASKVGIAGETFTVPTIPFTVTVAQGATYYEDLGVVNTTTGLAMIPAAAAADGAYTVSAAGVYVFHSAQAGAVVQINYSYTRAAAGKTVTIVNKPMGAPAEYICTLYDAFRAKYFGWKLWSVSIPKLSFGLKNDGFTMADLEFSARANSSGAVINMFSED